MSRFVLILSFFFCIALCDLNAQEGTKKKDSYVSQACDQTSALPPPPAWTRDLIIYEINPYAYTSPNGAGDGGGSGTFNSLRNKLDYLKELGITGIWLAGFNDVTTHFHNIPTVYASRMPQLIDSRLGTKDDLIKLIKEGHEKGIKFFLDVVTHGVVKESPLVKEHPDWFFGESWGMIDYDYDNDEFKEWWITLWVNHVKKYKMDGFRLDGPNGVEEEEKVLAVWHTIVKRCAEIGYPILVFPENASLHFKQGGRDMDLFEKNLAAKFSGSPEYRCRAISNHDCGHYQEGGKSHYRLNGSRFAFGYVYIFGYDIPLFMSGEEFWADYEPLPNAQRNLLGGGGSSAWLYASWMQWDQLNEQSKLEMLEDCKKIIRIKNDNSDLIHYNRSETNIVEISSTDETLPVPYARFIPGEKMVVVVGNDTEKDVTLTLTIPLKKMKMDGGKNYRVTDLWTGEFQIVSADESMNMEIHVPADFTRGGGVRIIKIEFLQ